MPGVWSIGFLAATLKQSPSALYRLADKIESHARVYELHNPEKPDKIRAVVSPRGRWRSVQIALLHQLFRPTFCPSQYSYGGVRGRNARQNAGRHLGSRFVYTSDIENFFPSISVGKVHAMFTERMKCADEVAGLLTRLCTFDGHLAQGLATSPILADQAVRRVDARIAVMCERHGLTYSRFVDDITISGPFGLNRGASGLVALVRRIVTDCGFAVAEHKERSGRLDGDDLAITGLRVVKGRLDVAADYIERLLSDIERHRAYANGGDLQGLLYTRDQLRSRVDYVCSVKRSHARSLKSRWASVDWDAVMRRAVMESLAVCRKRLVPVASNQAVRQSSNLDVIEGIADKPA